MKAFADGTNNWREKGNKTTHSVDSSSTFSKYDHPSLSTLPRTKVGRLSFNEFKYQTYFASKINHLVTDFYRDVISDLDITCVVERIGLKDERNDGSLSLLSKYVHYCILTNKKNKKEKENNKGHSTNWSTNEKTSSIHTDTALLACANKVKQGDISICICIVYH